MKTFLSSSVSAKSVPYSDTTRASKHKHPPTDVYDTSQRDIGMYSITITTTLHVFYSITYLRVIDYYFADQFKPLKYVDQPILDEATFDWIVDHSLRFPDLFNTEYRIQKA